MRPARELLKTMASMSRTCASASACAFVTASRPRSFMLRSNRRPKRVWPVPEMMIVLMGWRSSGSAGWCGWGRPRRGDPAVDDEAVAVDIGRVVAREEGGGRSPLLGVSLATHRDDQAP